MPARWPLTTSPLRACSYPCGSAPPSQPGDAARTCSQSSHWKTEGVEGVKSIPSTFPCENSASGHSRTLMLRMASALFPQSLLHSSGPWFGLVNGAIWQNVAKCPLVAQHLEAPVAQREISKQSKVLSLSGTRVGHLDKSVKRVMGHLETAQRGAEERGAGCAGQFLRQFDAHPRALVDDHDAVGVAQVHDLLSVGVVAGAE